MPFALRDYQVESVDAVVSAWRDGIQRPGLVLPTGAGKTVVLAEIAEHPQVRQRGRTLIIAHRKELIEQAAAKVRQQAPPHRRVGIVKGTANGVLADVVVGSVQTLRNPARHRQLRDVGTVIVDEAHHVTADSYRKILDHFGCFTPGGANALGVTATMSRGDGQRLGDVWEKIVYEKDIAWMIRRGYLVPVKGIRVQVPDLDMRRVKRMAGDYSDAALGAALEGSLAPQAIARAYTEHTPGRQAILFAPTVHSAEVIGDALTEAGWRVRLVWGEMPEGARTAALDDFRAGRVDILASCGILTEGTDLPMAEVGIMARPTTIAPLYIQMAGRVLRLHPGKERAVLLDVCGVTAKHALIAPVDLFGRELTEITEVDPDLLELEGFEEPEPEPERAPKPLIDGELEAVEVDLFRGTTATWKTTYAGYWFLATPRRYIAVVPGDDRAHYDVVWMDRTTPGVWGWVVRDVGDMAHAQRAAEGNVAADETLTTRRDAGWRGRPATEKAVGKARRLGLEVGAFMSGGEVSDMIDRALASGRIDPVQIQRASLLLAGSPR